MRKVFLISGLFFACLLLLLLTGMADADDAVKKALLQGKRYYDAGEYAEALTTYESALEVKPENEALNFNAAQSAYMLEEYEKAFAYYEKSADSADKFLNAGNAVTRLGDAESEDINLKVQYYAQALKTYQEGIQEYLKDVPLKYNYESVKKKLEELLQQSEQEEQDSGEESEGENEGEQSEEGQESQEGQEGQSQEESGDEQNEEQASQDNQEENTEQAAQDENGEQAGSDEQNQEEGLSEQDQEAIERILQMLEGQEEESLKNNQGVVSGNEGKNDW